MQLSNFDKANRLQQNPPQGKQTSSRLVNNHTHDLQLDNFLTEISVWEASHCSLIDFTMHWTDGSKNEATSELRKDVSTFKFTRFYVGCIPKKFQLAGANVECGIFIANATKLDILSLICIPEPELSSIVESFYNVGYIP